MKRYLLKIFRKMNLGQSLMKEANLKNQLILKTKRNKDNSLLKFYLKNDRKNSNRMRKKSEKFTSKTLTSENKDTEIQR